MINDCAVRLGPKPCVAREDSEYDEEQVISGRVTIGQLHMMSRIVPS